MNYFIENIDRFTLNELNEQLDYILEDLETVHQKYYNDIISDIK